MLELSDKIYTIGELNKILMESTYGYKPKIDPKVIKDDAQNNVKAVKDIMKETGAMEDKATTKQRDTNPENISDGNKTTLDNNFAYEPSKEYKERVKAQVHGFPSKENEDNSDMDESTDVEGNKEFYDERETLSKEQNDKETDERHAGLKAHNLPKENYKDKTIYKNESKKMKKLHFKNTKFLSEAQILKKVPDDYKTDGNRFIMEDCENNSFLVECKVDDTFHFAQMTVKRIPTKKQIEEEFDRMMQLASYNSKDYFKDTTNESRKEEEDNLSLMIEQVRKLEKENEGKKPAKKNK